MRARVIKLAGKKRWFAAAGALVALTCVAAAAVAQAAQAGAALMKVRLGGDSAQTRIVLDLDRTASAKVVADGASDRRLVVVFPGVSAAALQGAGQGLVRAWTVDETGQGARLQADLSADATIKRRFLLPPADGVDHYRYVIDVVVRDEAVAPAPSAPTPEVRLTKATGPVLAKLTTAAAMPRGKQALSLKKVVVIDAGHGGHDPGARGADGHEKDINLAAAQALKAKLERTGRYKVVMTRDADVYVPLEDRVRIAQRASADLFISLHADSGPDPTLSGASVYTLSDKATARSARFVSKDDWYAKASLTGGVQDILLDLTQRATRNRSSVFAQNLVTSLEPQAPLLRRSHRDAGFMVLLAPNVPAVLLEMGFVSNPEDEGFLRSEKGRGRLVTGVADAIDDYFAEATRLAAR
jgi:N-acetylmuramoyl-L-alanine amidase